jgi:hypothetical protein
MFWGLCIFFLHALALDWAGNQQFFSLIMHDLLPQSHANWGGLRAQEGFASALGEVESAVSKQNLSSQVVRCNEHGHGLCNVFRAGATR